MNKIIFVMMIAGLVGCSAHQVKPEAQNIEIVIEVPDQAKCQYLGEVAGSQGNWFTGDFTSNENLVVGARNELRAIGVRSCLLPSPASVVALR